MSTERSGIDPYKGDIDGNPGFIEKDFGVITPGGGGGSGAPTYKPIYYTPWA